jgi:hypothetical protein
MLSATNEVVLPGRIVSSNADSVSGDTASWSLSLDSCDTGIVMKAVARRMNWVAIISVAVLAIALLAVLVRSVVRARRRAGDDVEGLGDLG